VRTQRAGRGVNDLKLFFNTDSEAVSHGVALRMALVSLGTSRAVSYSAGGKNACVLEEARRREWRNRARKKEWGRQEGPPHLAEVRVNAGS
jgi:hypothetical protein